MSNRREVSNGLQDSMLGLGNVNVASPKRIEIPCKPEICKNQDESDVNGVLIEDLGSNTKSSKPQSRKQKDSTGCCKRDLAHAFIGSQEMELEDSSLVGLQNEKNSKKISRPIQVVSHQENMHSCIESEIPKTQDKLSHVNCVRIKDLGNNISSSTPQSCKQKDTAVCKKRSPADAFNGPQEMWLDASSMAPLQNVERCKENSSTIQLVNQQEKIFIGSELNGSVSNTKVKFGVHYHFNCSIVIHFSFLYLTCEPVFPIDFLVMDLCLRNNFVLMFCEIWD